MIADIEQINFALCRDGDGSSGKLVWLGDAWGQYDSPAIFLVEAETLIEVLEMCLAKLRGMGAAS